jgi:uroporphyrinogen decarboxylase
MFNWLKTLRDSKIKRPMPILSFPGIQLLGITVKDLVYSSDNQAKLMLEVSKRAPSAASVSIMDLSVEAEAFGSTIRFSDDEVPTVVGKIVSSLEEAKNLRMPKVGEKRTGIYVEAIQKAARLINDRPVFAGAIGSFSLAGRLVDVTEAMINCYEEPEMMKEVLNKCTDFIIEYIKEFKKAGADGVVLAEPLTGLLSLSLAEEFSEPYIKRIVDSVQDENFIVIYHNCGNSTINIIESILRTGSAAYHFGNSIDMAKMLEHVPADTVTCGNVDPAGQFRNGTPESIYAVTSELLKKCAKYPNYVPSSGCDIPPLSKWENIDAFFKAVEDYYKQNA